MPLLAHTKLEEYDFMHGVHEHAVYPTEEVIIPDRIHHDEANSLLDQSAESFTLPYIKQEEICISESNSIDDGSTCLDGTEDDQDDDDNNERHGRHGNTIFPIVESTISDRIHESEVSETPENENGVFIETVKKASTLLEKFIYEQEKDNVFHFSQNVFLRLKALPPLSRTMAMNRIENLLYESEAELATQSG